MRLAVGKIGRRLSSLAVGTSRFGKFITSFENPLLIRKPFF